MPSITFEAYLKQVDATLLRLCGMTRDMLPDWSYYDDYAEGKTFVQCAKRALRYARQAV